MLPVPNFFPNQMKIVENKENLIYALKETMVFMVQMFSKIIFSQLNSMKIFYIALHSYRSINMESTEKKSMMPLSKYIHHCPDEHEIPS
jgi:hypothetical protein